MTDLSPSGIRGLGQKAAAETLRQARMVRTMAIAGVIRPHHPVRLTHAARAIIDQGIGFAGGIGAQAALNPDHTALIDELGSLTWKQIDQRSTRLANALAHLFGYGADRGELRRRVEPEVSERLGVTTPDLEVMVSRALIDIQELISLFN